MARYVIDPARSQVVVSARSSIHDTRTRWDAVSGTIEVDAADPGGAATQAEVGVDMRKFDAGDFLKNRKVKKDLEVDRHPRALFQLETLAGVESTGAGRFRAKAGGSIEWRGRKVAVVAEGEAEIAGAELRAKGRFELDVRGFGVEPPRFLMFKVEEVVAVEVVLVAHQR